MDRFHTFPGDAGLALSEDNAYTFLVYVLRSVANACGLVLSNATAERWLRGFVAAHKLDSLLDDSPDPPLARHIYQVLIRRLAASNARDPNAFMEWAQQQALPDWAIEAARALRDLAVSLDSEMTAATVFWFEQVPSFISLKATALDASAYAQVVAAEDRLVNNLVLCCMTREERGHPAFPQFAHSSTHIMVMAGLLDSIHDMSRDFKEGQILISPTRRNRRILWRSIWRELKLHGFSPDILNAVLAGWEEYRQSLARAAERADEARMRESLNLQQPESHRFPGDEKLDYSVVWTVRQDYPGMAALICAGARGCGMKVSRATKELWFRLMCLSQVLDALLDQKPTPEDPGREGAHAACLRAMESGSHPWPPLPSGASRHLPMLSALLHNTNRINAEALAYARQILACAREKADARSVLSYIHTLKNESRATALMVTRLASAEERRDPRFQRFENWLLKCMDLAVSRDAWDDLNEDFANQCIKLSPTWPHRCVLAAWAIWRSIVLFISASPQATWTAYVEYRAFINNGEWRRKLSALALMRKEKAGH